MKKCISPSTKSTVPILSLRSSTASRAVCRLCPVPEGHHDPAQVDQVEAHHQQMVDGIGERVLPVERVDQERPAVAVERSRDPDGDGNGDDEVGDVSVQHVHGRLSRMARPFLNAFKSRMPEAGAPVNVRF